MQTFGDWRRHGPDEGGGGTFAVVGLLGFVLFALIFAAVELARRLRSLVTRGGVALPSPRRVENDEEPGK